MRRLLILAAMILFFSCVPMFAQALPAARVVEPFWSGAQVFTEGGYGLGAWSAGGGIGLEHAFGAFETDTYIGAFAGQKTTVNLPALFFTTKERGIVWIHNVGIYGDVRWDPDLTPQYTKSQWEYSTGVVFSVPKMPARIFAGYISQFENGVSAAGVETSHLKGAELAFEFEAGTIARRVPVRVGFQYDVLTGLEQGNQFCDGSIGPDTCGSRTRFVNGNVAGRVTFEVGHRVGGFAR